LKHKVPSGKGEHTKATFTIFPYPNEDYQPVSNAKKEHTQAFYIPDVFLIELEYLKHLCFLNK